MRVRGYLEELDTVRFNIEGRDENIGALNASAFERVALYGVFYGIVLSPNQVLDLKLLRDRFDPLTATFPFVVSLEPDAFGTRRPFREQLLSFLRREGDDAFVFSSVADGSARSDRWKAFLDSHRRKLTNSQLYEQASREYGEIVQWVERLDGASERLRKVPFRPAFDFQHAYSAVAGVDLASAEPPKSRSAALRWILRRLGRDLGLPAQEFPPEEDVIRARAIPDLASQLVYSSGTRSRLVLASDTNLATIVPPEALQESADVYVRLDVSGLYRAYKELPDAFAACSVETLVQAWSRGRLLVDQGWDLVRRSRGKRDDQAAARCFGGGLEEFLRVVIGEDHARDLTIPFARTDAWSGHIEFVLPLELLSEVAHRAIRRVRGLSRFVHVDRPSNHEPTWRQVPVRVLAHGLSR